jgi:multidrug transporter EmrE-like cation transporter
MNEASPASSNPNTSNPQTSEKKKKSMGISTQGIILVIIAASIMAVSSLMLNYSIDKIGGFAVSFSTLPQDIWRILREPIFLIALFLYAGGTLLWMKVMSTEPISIGYPILVAVSFVVIGLGGIYFFKESLTPQKLIGMVVILVGVMLASFEIK